MKPTATRILVEVLPEESETSFGLKLTEKSNFARVKVLEVGDRLPETSRAKKGVIGYCNKQTIVPISIKGTEHYIIDESQLLIVEE